MTYYPPVGKELQAVKSICKSAGKIHDLAEALKSAADDFAEDPAQSCDIESCDWRIKPRFALEGVRVNGRERTTTLASFLLFINRIQAEAAKRRSEIVAHMDALEKLFGQVEKACDQFQLCPACKGENGSKIPNVLRHGEIGPRTRWQDCDCCQGRGVLLLEAV